MFSTASLLAGVGVRAVSSVVSGIASAVGAVADSVSGDSATPSARISISADAKAALQRVKDLEQDKEKLRTAAQNDPVLASQLAQQLAYGQEALTVRTDKNNWANTRFANGTPVTDTSYQVSMDSQISAVRQQRIALYETERAKGTPPAEIYDKLQAFNARLPNDYKSATGLLA